MEKKDLAWSSGAVFICEKCSKSIATKPNESSFAEDLKTFCRAQLKEQGLHKNMRVMVSGCLDICQKGVQAAAVFDKTSKESFVLTFDPVAERDEFFRQVQLRAKGTT